jgi:hypothetical protein
MSIADVHQAQPCVVLIHLQRKVHADMFIILRCMKFVGPIRDRKILLVAL